MAETHRLPTQRWWTLLGIALYCAASMRQITAPDYNTSRRAPAEEWLWVVVPATVAVAFIAWRAWRSRVDTGPAGIAIHRVTAGEEIPWERVRGFEVKRTPNGWGWRAVVRHTDGRTSRLGGVPGRTERSRRRVEAFVEGLEAERHRHAVAAAGGR